MIKRIFILFSGIVLFVSSCRKDQDYVETTQEHSILFSSKITGQVQTRVSGNQWDANDSISIYMYEGNSLNSNSVLSTGFNKQFVTDRSGNFSPKNPIDEIQFPIGKTVNFISFYPYQKGDLFKRELNIYQQDKQSQIDYLIGKSTGSIGLQQGPVRLSFERIMAKIQVRVKGEGIQSATGLIKNLQTTGSFNLETGLLASGNTYQDVPGKVIQSGSETIIEWVVFPGKLNSNSTIVFKSQTGSTYTWEIGKQGTDFIRGNRYQYDIALGKNGDVTPTPKVSYMELPVISNSSDLEFNFKMTPDGSKRNFSMLYDKKNRLAYWVAYPLSSDYLGGQSRTNDWGYDPDFNTSFQPLLSKGFGIGGIDRGHQIPSGDRTKNRAENATTFYYTNMTAQVSSMNQGVWAKLENQIRGWTTSSGVDTMYVVTGAVIQTSTDSNIEYVQDNSGKSVAKPKYYYKALAMKRGTAYYTIGFKINNETMNTQANPSSYRITVSELEKETGYTFFPGLDAETKQTINNSFWR